MRERAGATRPLALLLLAALRASPAAAVSVFVLQTASQLATLLFAVGLAAMVDAAAAHDGMEAAVAATVLTALFVGLWAAMGTAARLRATLEERVAGHLERQLIEAATSSATVEPFFDPSYRDRLAAFTDNRELIERAFGAIVIGFAVVVRAAVGVAVLAAVSPLLALLPVFGIPSQLVSRRSEAAAARVDERAAAHLRRARHWFAIATEATPAMEVCLAGNGADIRRRHGEELDAARAIVLPVRLQAIVASGFARLIFVAGYSLAVAFTVEQARQGATGPGSVVLVVVLGAQISTMLGATAARIRWMQRTLREASRFLWLLDYAGRHHGSPSAQPAAVPERLETGLATRCLGYRYPGSSNWAIRDVSLDLEPGTVVAVVGGNGSGNTTLRLRHTYRMTSDAFEL